MKTPNSFLKIEKQRAQTQTQLNSNPSCFFFINIISNQPPKIQMDFFFNSSHTDSETISYQFNGSDSQSSSSSEDSSTNRATTFSSDEEADQIILASNNPKKRAGRMKFKETRHPIYRGVRKRNNEKWVCELREPNKKTRIWLGTYSTPEMAARAHDVAAIALRGKSACLNFADSVWRLPVPVSSNAKDIRKAAAEAAKSFADDNKHSEVTSCMKKSLAEKVVYYIDEEDELEMPRLLADMAQGLLLAPPCYSIGKGFHWDDMDFTAEVSLWNY